MTNIPTIQALYTSILADLEAEVGVNLPTIGKVLLRAFAAVQAARLKLFYLQIARLQKNLFVDSADPEASGGTLERFGRVKLNRDPFAATQGQYVVTVIGDIGATIPALTTFKANDTAQNAGKLFILDEEYTLVATTDTITLRALEAGTDSKLYPDEALTATIPLAGVEEVVSVAGEQVAPQEAEDIEAYRQKVIAAYRLETQGGSAADYRLWGYDAQGVEEIYPYAKSGAPNEIDVYVEATIADSTDGKGTPSTAILEEVEDVIELDPDTTKALSERGRRPLGVYAVNVLPVTVKEVDITISNYQNLTTSLQSTIEAAIEEAVNSVRPYIAGADIPENKRDVLSTYVIINAIMTAVPGSVFTALTLEIDSTPYTTFSFVQGNIPHLNSVTFA